MSEARPGKVCGKCGRWQPFEHFSKSRSSKGGYQSRCKDCHAEGNLAWRRKRPHYDAIRALAKRLPPGTPIYTEQEWYALCEKHGKKCLCCGRKNVRLYADHVNPDGSHTIDNIQPLCRRCNNSKGNQNIDYRGEGSPKASEPPTATSSQKATEPPRAELQVHRREETKVMDRTLNCLRCSHEIGDHEVAAHKNGDFDGLVEGPCHVQGCDCQEFMWFDLARCFCGHLVSSHADPGESVNDKPCRWPGCDCRGFG